MKHIIIFNPAARSGRAANKEQAVKRAFREAGVEAEMWKSERQGHAVELAKRAASEADVVVAAGGDGAVQETARGVIQAGTEAALGLVPLGTGNDFAKAVGVPSDWQAAVRLLGQAETRLVDVGRITWKEQAKVCTRYFVNAVGAGFDAQVACSMQTDSWLGGTAAYMVGVFRALRRWHSPYVEICGGAEKKLYEGPLLLMTVSNGICSGGGFYLTPTASVEDGALDVCLIEDVTTPRLFQLLPMALRGKHGAQPEVRMHRLRSVTLRSAEALPLHADGEVLTDCARHLEVSVVPAHLSIRVAK